MLSRLARFARDSRGAVAPLFAVSLLAVVGAGALAWDVSRGYALRAELEAAADAAALAGATQLDGQPDAITRADTAALGALVQNAHRLADTYEVNTVGAGDTIQYLTDLTTRTVTTDPAEANFIEITLAPRTMGLVLGGLVGAGGFNARAHAVAGYGRAICKVPPMMICNPMDPDPFDGDALTGKGLVLSPAPNTGAWAPGQFGFLAVAGGANALNHALARSPPETECYGETATTRGGNVAAADGWINIRFDLYRNGGPNGVRNDPAYPPAMNTIIGVKTNPGASACTATPVAPTNTCSPDVAVIAGGMGLPRDCNQTGTGTGSGVWNVAKYFANNHAGLTWPYTPAAGWAAYGPSPTDPNVTVPTRWQVYNWELAMLKGVAGGGIATPAGAFSGGQNVTSAGVAKDYARPQCSAGATQATPDRRKISVVVLNCVSDNIHANQPATVRGFMDLFLIAPVTSPPATAAQTIYAEYIEATSDTSTVGEETLFHSVRLYE